MKNYLSIQPLSNDRSSKKSLTPLYNKEKINDLKFEKEIYEKYYRLVFSVCLRYTKEQSVAKQWTNDAFVKVFRFYKDQTAYFESWLTRVTINSCLDNIRREKKYYSRNFDIDEVEDPKLDNHIVEELTAQEILSAIDTLPENLRIVFTLHAIEGYTHPEISEQLKINTNTSKWYLSEAKKKLKPLLENLYSSNIKNPGNEK